MAILDIFNQNLELRGCGYYSVCFEAGHSCPCHIKQVYDETTWDSLLIELKAEQFATLKTEPTIDDFVDSDDNYWENWEDW